MLSPLLHLALWRPLEIAESLGRQEISEGRFGAFRIREFRDEGVGAGS